MYIQLPSKVAKINRLISLVETLDQKVSTFFKHSYAFKRKLPARYGFIPSYVIEQLDQVEGQWPSAYPPTFSKGITGREPLL